MAPGTGGYSKESEKSVHGLRILRSIPLEVYIYIYIYIHIYIYIQACIQLPCMCVYIYIYLFIYLLMYLFIYIDVFAYLITMASCMYVCMLVCLIVCTHACMPKDRTMLVSCVNKYPVQIWTLGGPYYMWEGQEKQGGKQSEAARDSDTATFAQPQTYDILSRNLRAVSVNDITLP